MAHAATAATRQASFARGDEPPEAAGLATAAALRCELRTSGKAFTSPALAACRTAEVLGLPASCEPCLRDLDAGRWTGERVAAIPPSDLAAWLVDPDFAGHGGESVAALVSRVGSFLATRLADADLVAVTHGAVLRAALVAVLGAPASAFWRIEAPPLAILTLSSDARRWRLRSLALPKG